MRTQRVLFLGLFAVAALIYTVAISSKVYLGDECFHYRFTKVFFESGRPLQEPSYDHAPKIGYQFTAPVLWYWGLQASWKLFHSINAWVTQGYQISYYILLLIFGYFFSRALGSDQNQSLLTSWFLASCPMVVAFSILLYQDVPACAFMLLTFYLLFKRRFFLGGIAYGLLILIKQYGFFLGPGMALALFFLSPKSIGEKIKNSFIFFGTAFLILLPDILFRLKYFGFAYYAPPHPQFVNKELSYWYVTASIIHDPVGALSYLGIAMLLGLAAYFSLKQRQPWDWILWLTAAIYSALFVVFFPRTLDMRYFMPAVCLLSPLAARGMAKIQQSWIRNCFYAIFVLQILATSWNVYTRRQIPPEIEQAFAFIREKLPPKAVVYYPAENIMNETGRPVVWGYVPHMQDLFWSPSSEKVYAALQEAYIDFVVVPEEKIYDDTKVRHTGGYPKSFSDRLKAGREFPFLKQIYHNPKISIWEVKKDVEA